MTHPETPSLAAPGTGDQAWADLALRTGAPPAAHPGWARAWALHHDLSLDCASLERSGRLVAALPLVDTRAGVATPTDWHTPLFAAAAEDDAALRSLADRIAAAGPARIELGFLDAAGPTAAAFTDRLSHAGYSVHRFTRLRTPYLLLDGDWDSYLGGWSAKRRSTYRRHHRRLAEQGTVAFEVVDGSVDLPALLTECFEVENAGWKGEAGTSILAEGTSRFYRNAAAWAAEAGLLRIGFLRLDGVAIAFDFSVEVGGTHFMLKTGFRPEMAAFKPGLLLRGRMIEQAFTDGLSMYDFGGDAESWKLRWTGTTRRVDTLMAFAPTGRGRLARATWLPLDLARRLKRRILRSPLAADTRTG